jgi:hypothetical protein
MEIDQQDILHTQNFSGIHEIEHLGFKIISPGGTRNERKKWIHCFDDVSCLFFFANLSGYRRNLREDPNTNHLDEEKKILGDLLNLRYFKNVPIFLILSKVDLFQESLDRFPLMEDIHKDFDSSKMTPIEYIISKLNPTNVEMTIFENCQFDLERNDFLFELMIKKLNGEKLEKYYPYKFSMKPKLSPKLFDLNFFYY